MYELKRVAKISFKIVECYVDTIADKMLILTCSNGGRI